MKPRKPLKAEYGSWAIAGPVTASRKKCGAWDYKVRIFFYHLRPEVAITLPPWAGVSFRRRLG
jgi:hypothetical protein